MSIYEKILNNVHFAVIVWEKKNDIILCTFNNKNNEDAKVGTNIESYLNKNHKLQALYNKLFELKKDQDITIDNEYIKLYYQPDDIYYEIRSDIKHIYNFNMLSFISNQTRNPLTSILGNISLLRDTELSNIHKNYLNTIEQSSYDIISLMNDLVDIINLGQGKIKINAELVDFKKCVTDALKIAAVNSEKKLSFTYKIDNNIQKNIKTDRKRLTQILINLIKIAATNTEFGTIKLEIIPFTKENQYDCPFEFIDHESGTNILFIIRDTGSGLDRDTIMHMESVLGIQKHNVKTYQNYEFGLSICKYLCNLMKGNIWFKSLQDFGTIYYFNIVCE
jgi:two-component system, sensor histidine kinase